MKKKLEELMVYNAHQVIHFKRNLPEAADSMAEKTNVQSLGAFWAPGTLSAQWCLLVRPFETNGHLTKIPGEV